MSTLASNQACPRNDTDKSFGLSPLPTGNNYAQQNNKWNVKIGKFQQYVIKRSATVSNDCDLATLVLVQVLYLTTD